VIRPVVRARLLLAALILGTLALSGCPSAEARLALRQCQFSVHDIRIRGYGALAVELEVDLTIHNPNDIDVIVDQLDYTLYLNGRKFALGETTRDVTIPRGRDGILPITMRLNVVDLGFIAPTLIRGKDRVLDVKATYYVAVPWGRYPYPIELRHRF
jgi:LEA14-like dessication related protein